MAMDAYVEWEEANPSLCYITCQLDPVGVWNGRPVPDVTLTQSSPGPAREEF